jgi:hypothetical protein
VAIITAGIVAIGFVLMNGKEYRLKGDHGIVFVNLTEGIFFFDELVESEGNE